MCESFKSISITNGQVMYTRNQQCSRSRGPSRRGAVAAEAALLLGALITGLFGVFEYERLVTIRKLINNTACEGATLDGMDTPRQRAITAQQTTKTVSANFAGEATGNVE